MDECSIKRFWDKVDVRDPDECWLWIGAATKMGYGQFYYPTWGKSLTYAHRFSYFLATGVIPNVCRHTCDNPPCVNPSHLLDGTRKDNSWDSVIRGRARNNNNSKTHCLRGHELTGENLCVFSQSRSSVVTGRRRLMRACRTCRVETTRRWRTQHKTG